MSIVIQLKTTDDAERFIALVQDRFGVGGFIEAGETAYCGSPVVYIDRCIGEYSTEKKIIEEAVSKFDGEHLATEFTYHLDTGRVTDY